MSNEHPYPPCPSCGGVEFDSLPDLAFEPQQAKLIGGTPAYMKIPGAQFLVFTFVVCSGCGKTDVYTKNAAKVAQRCEGATHFRAARSS